MGESCVDQRDLLGTFLLPPCSEQSQAWTVQSGKQNLQWDPIYFNMLWLEIKLSEHCQQCCSCVTALSKGTPDPDRLGCWFSTLSAPWDIGLQSVTNLKVISVPWLQLVLWKPHSPQTEVVSPQNHSCAIRGVRVISCAAPARMRRQYLIAGVECTVPRVWWNCL